MKFTKSQAVFINFNFIVIAILLCLSAFSQIGYAQDDVIRVDTELVIVPATVLDREGRYVTNLRKEDFQIFENGVEQEITIFEPIEKPFTILFLLDTSGSMNNKMAHLARAANAFVNQLRPNDQIIVALFDDWVDVLSEVKSIKDFRENKTFRLRTKGSAPITMVYDAVDYALKKMKKIRGRKAIVLFSDGVGSGYSATVKSNLRDAEESEALIYTVQFNTYPKIAPPYVNKKQYYENIDIANNYLQNLAQKTSGRHYQIEDVSNLEKTFGMVAEELSRQYSLGYYPEQLEAGQKRQTRQIKVKMRQLNLVVRARSSYVIEPQKKTKQ